jgi:hypothetical protein
MVSFRGSVNLGIVLWVAAVSMVSACSADLVSAGDEDRRQGRYEEALDQYAAALGGKTQLRAAERGIEMVLRERLPLWIREAHLDRLPMDRVEVLSRTAGPFEVVILRPRPHAAPAPARDAGKTRLAYEQCAGVYELRDGRYTLAGVARWAKGVPDDAALRALRVFELCRLGASEMGIHRLHHETSRADTNYRGRSIVWISPEGSPGGETIGVSVWLSGITEDLAAEELVRIVAHETGHAFIPPISGCAEPEPTGEGYLGEILLLRYLVGQGIPILGEPEPQAQIRDAVSGKADRLEAAYRAHAGERDPGGDIEGLRALIGGLLVLLDERGAQAVAGLLPERGLDRSDLWTRVRHAADGSGGGEESRGSGGR